MNVYHLFSHHGYDSGHVGGQMASWSGVSSAVSLGRYLLLLRWLAVPVTGLHQVGALCLGPGLHPELHRALFPPRNSSLGGNHSPSPLRGKH